MATETVPYGRSTQRPPAVKEATASAAMEFTSPVGRITAQSGKSGLMNSHGTGKIKLV